MVTYEGKDGYIFISYAHKDSKRVLPIVEALHGAGYRIWYDAGIEAGTEWPEYVAERLSSSALVLVFLTNHALASQNCTREINFAIAKRKEMLVIHMEEVQMSLGMEMQLGTLQAMFYERYESVPAFVGALQGAKLLCPCKTEIENAPIDVRPIPTPVVLEKAPSLIFTQEAKAYRSKYGAKCGRYLCCTVSAQSGCAGKIVVPETSPENLPVGYIGANGFSLSRITEVTIPKSVRAICENAFFSCSELTKVNIEQGLQEIRPHAFEGCAALTQIAFPESLQAIGDNAFDFCSALESAPLNDGLLQIGARAFASCERLQSVRIPKTVKQLGAGAFALCKNVTTLTIENGVEIIGAHAFKGMELLESVFIPRSVRYIASQAFADCKNLKTIYCECSQKPFGWESAWNGSRAEAVWGSIRGWTRKLF